MNLKSLPAGWQVLDNDEIILEISRHDCGKTRSTSVTDAEPRTRCILLLDTRCLKFFSGSCSHASMYMYSECSATSTKCSNFSSLEMVHALLMTWGDEICCIRWQDDWASRGWPHHPDSRDLTTTNCCLNPFVGLHFGNASPAMLGWEPHLLLRYCSENKGCTNLQRLFMHASCIFGHIFSLCFATMNKRAIIGGDCIQVLQFYWY